MSVTKPCPHCSKGSWVDSNGVKRRCSFCNGTGGWGTSDE